LYKKRRGNFFSSFLFKIRGGNMNRNFVIFDVAELDKIDFSQVLETSVDTIRKSVNSQKTFVKWDGDDIPVCVLDLTSKSEYYTLEEMLAILDTDEWTNKITVDQFPQ
jgi:hypothetical protein